MADNGILSLLGLAKRAGKLAAGDDPVRDLARDGVIRAVFLSQDAGAASARQAAFTAEKAGVPLLKLPVTKAELGSALGHKVCALCALSDSGFAAKAAQKLAALDPSFAGAAAALAEKHARIQSRRGVKKRRSGENAGAETGSRTAEAPLQKRSRRTAPHPRVHSSAPWQTAKRTRDAGAYPEGTAHSSPKRPRKRLGKSDNNQPLADKRPAGPRKRKAPAIEHPRKLRR